MKFLENIKEHCYKIATLGRIGRWWFGGIIATIFAFPVIVLGKFIYEFSSTFFYWSTGITLIISFLIVWIATKHISTQYSANIVIDKVIGMCVAFFFVPLHWKMILFGFILFNVINFLRPILFRKSLGDNIEKLPLGVGIISGDIISGITSNLIMQLIIWVMS